jgi:hypothetical protein
MSLGSKALLTAGVDMMAVLWKEVRRVWLWWYFGRAARVGKLFLEEERRRDVGRARNIV